jgi:Flp pilus assembly pilin Flp
MRHSLKKLIGDRRAVTSIKYAFITSLIALAIVGSLTNVGDNLFATFSMIASSMP